MKRFFLYFTLIILVLIFGSSFFAEYYIQPINTEYLLAAKAVGNSFLLALVSGILAWILGILIRFLLRLEKSKFLRGFFLNTLNLLPSFFLSALIVLMFDGILFTVLAISLPVFIMVLKSEDIKPKDRNLKAYMGGGYLKKYVLAVYIKPMIFTLLNGIRICFYMDLGLGALGLMPSYTLGGLIFKDINDGFYLIGLGILILILANTRMAFGNAVERGICKMEKALDFKNLSLSYNGRRVLKDINIEVFKSEIVAICGAEDSGARYIENIVLRMHDFPYRLSGTAAVNGIEIEMLNSEDMRYVRMFSVGVLSPADTMSGFMTGKEYIAEIYGEKVNKPKREVILNAKRILELMEFKNPEKLLKKNMGRLKPHEKRGVIYAGAMATDPALIISHGPDKDMRAEEVDRFYTLIKKVCKIKNMGMIVLNSDPDFAQKYCEKTYYLENGSIVDSVGTGFEKPPISRDINFVFDNVILSKGDKYAISKNLYKGEVFGIYTNNKKAKWILTGNKKPFLNSILKDGKSIYKTGEMFLIDGKTPNMFLPHVKVIEILRDFAILGGAEQKTRRKMNIEKLVNLLKLEGVTGATAYELESLTKYKLGLACAALGGYKGIVLCEVDKIESKLDRHYIYDALCKICNAEKMSAVVLSGSLNTLHSVCNSVFDMTGKLTEDENFEIIKEDNNEEDSGDYAYSGMYNDTGEGGQ